MPRFFSCLSGQGRAALFRASSAPAAARKSPPTVRAACCCCWRCSFQESGVDALSCYFIVSLGWVGLSHVRRFVRMFLHFISWILIALEYSCYFFFHFFPPPCPKTIWRAMTASVIGREWCKLISMSSVNYPFNLAEQQPVLTAVFDGLKNLVFIAIIAW